MQLENGTPLAELRDELLAAGYTDIPDQHVGESLRLDREGRGVVFVDLKDFTTLTLARVAIVALRLDGTVFINATFQSEIEAGQFTATELETIRQLIHTASTN